VVVPVPLRRLTAIDVLDGGIATIKADPRRVLTVAAVLVVPVQIVSAIVTRARYGDANFDQLFNQTGNFSTSTGTFTSGADLLVVVLSLLVLPLVAAGIARLVSAWYVGVRPTVGEALSTVANRAWPLLVAGVLVHVTEFAATIAFVFPGIMVMTLWLVTAPAIAIERLGPIAGMKRSSALTRRRYWPCMGLALLVAFVNLMLSGALSALASAVLFVSWGWIIGSVIATLATIVTTAFVASTAVLMYLDLRVRTEGLDIELEAAGVLDRAA
jgi:hypothetical protein